MSPSTTVLHAAMEAQAVTFRQQRLIVLAGRLCQLIGATPLSPRQRAMVIGAEGLLGEFARLTERQAEHHRTIAGIADQLAPPERGRSSWSLRKVVRETRDPLANLLNPTITGTRRDEALARVRFVIAEAPEIIGTFERPNLRLRHELSARKYTLLLALAAEEAHA